MKIIGITSTAILSLLLGVARSCLCTAGATRRKARPRGAATGWARAGPSPNRSMLSNRNRSTLSRQQQQSASSSSTQQQQQARQPAAARAATAACKQQQPAAARSAATAAGPATTSSNAPQAQPTSSHSTRKQQQRVQQSAWQQHRSQNWQSDHRNWQQRGGYHGYRIPDDRYRGYFGPSHGFRINTLPFLVVGGYPRFQYQGYWISAVDPWPEYWGNDWYDNDDVYVNYVDNGYYLYNRRYPSAGIAINITL